MMTSKKVPNASSLCVFTDVTLLHFLIMNLLAVGVGVASQHFIVSLNASLTFPFTVKSNPPLIY